MNIEKLVNLFQNTHNELQSRAARSVDIYLVVRNWLFGWYIVEFEQNGENRAEYGKKLLKEISKRLKDALGRGFSVDNLELFRKFYLTYQHIPNSLEKSETVSGIFKNLISETVSRNSQKHEKPNKNNSSDLKTTLPAQFVEFLFSHFNLGWSHYVTLLTINSAEGRRFFAPTEATGHRAS